MVKAYSPERQDLAKRLFSCRTLEEALTCLGVADDWDYLLIGDGSGTSWHNACGWGSSLLLRGADGPLRFWGGFSHGTNNVAEMMAVIQPLLWIANACRLPTDRPSIVRVLTDSEVLADCGNYQQYRRANLELWTLLDSLKRKAIQVTFHWIPRNVLALHRLADRIAGDSRLAIANQPLPTLDDLAPKRKTAKGRHATQ